MHPVSILTFCLTAALTLTTARADAAKPSSGAPVNLKCEYQSDPLGLDIVRPRLSWWLNDSSQGARQTAYHVLVASDGGLLAKNKGDLWDSSKQASDQSIHVPYAGKPLGSGQRCYWKVRTWDAAGNASPWSDTATWEMALLKTGDWKANWITTGSTTQEEVVPLSDWYWHPTARGDNKTVFFRTEVHLPADSQPNVTTLAITADNDYEVFVNGRRVGADGSWETVEKYVRGGVNMKPGRNIVAVKVKNVDGPAGLAVGLSQVYFGGKRDVIVPSKWLCIDKPTQGWQTPDFNASGWVEAKVVGKQGAKPWGKFSREADGPRRSTMTRKAFTLPADVTRARAYVSGLGFYELHINGRRVGEDVFTPGWTQYEKRIQYQTYDVTALLKRGANAVGAILGNGWWSSGLGWGGGKARHALPGENLRLVLQLEISCSDGSEHTVVTDPTWAWHNSPIVEDTLYHGETYDARLETPGWDTPEFDAADWLAVTPVKDDLNKLCAQRCQPLRVTETLKPEKISEPQPGVYVLDFGQNHPGRPKLKVQAPAGTTIKIAHSELLLDDGTIRRDNYRTARVTDTYICKGSGLEEWEARFVYRGFRYMQVTGLPRKPAKDTIVSQVLHSASPMAGTFECSNPLLNRILGNVRWGQRSNMHSVPTDCPQRDERLGWMGDAQVFAPMSIWNMDMALFYTKWMRDIQQAQQPNGAVPGVCPTVGKWVIGPGRSGWADAITTIPWFIYLYYGDEQILAENYDGSRRWVEFIRSKLNKDGLYEEDTWGDWVPVVKTPPKPIAAMYGHHSANLQSRMAATLGKKEDAANYAKLAEAQRAAFNKKHLNLESHNYIGGTQCANALPLAFGMVDAQHRQAVADNIAADAEKRGGHHTTGFLGTPVILPVLADHGYAELAYRIVSSDEYPSLGYMLKNGATAIWERWNSDKEGPGMNSRNHFAFGCMGQWFYEGLAGLNPDPAAPGFKHILVKPHVVGDLTWVRATYPTPFGKLATEWKRNGKELTLDLTVPPNATATVCLPATGTDAVKEKGGAKATGMKDGRAILEVAAGSYSFTSTMP